MRVRLPFPGLRRSRREASRAIRAFQPDAAEIAEAPVAAPIRWVLYGLLALIVTGVSWASLASIDRIVSAPGRLVTVAPTVVVQPLETSVVRSLDVQVGDLVRKGQVLATLDPTFAQADVESLRARRKGLDALIARLEAELDGTVFTGEGLEGEERELQLAIDANRRSQYRATLKSFDERLDELEASRTARRQERAFLVGRLEIVRKVEAMRRELAARDHASKLNVLDAQYARLEAERLLDLAATSLQELEHRIASAEAEKEAFIQQWREKAGNELFAHRQERQSIEEQLTKASRRRDMVTLTAPMDAVVLEAAARSVGSVVREAEALYTLVPVDVPLEAEIRIRASDIGHVKTGDAVRIKFAAFPFQKHDVAHGRVRTISENSFQPGGEDGAEAPPGGAVEPVYRGRVELTDLSLRNLSADFRLLPGMTLTAEIKVGERKVASYFTYPLLKGLDESLREP